MQHSTMNLSVDLWQWIATVLIGVTIIYVVNFYLNVRKYPRGPFPLPGIGNIAYLFSWTHINKGRNPLYKFDELASHYGPIFTLWFGTKPAVFINDPSMVREVFDKNNASDRPFKTLARFYTEDKGVSIVFSNFGHQWASLRKVALTAIRKYANSEQFASLCSETVDQAVRSMQANEITSQPFDVSKYIWLTLINVVSNMIFGDHYNIDDEKFIHINKLFADVQHTIDVFGFIDGLPDVLKPIGYKIGQRSFACVGEMRNLCREKFMKHLDDYKPGVIRDLSDALICAKEEAIRERKETADDLTDESLSVVVLDLFGAGIDTTASCLKWCFLMLAVRTDLQLKLRDEIRREIGDRAPVHSDKNRCHLLMAFIAECLRFRPVGSLAAPHQMISSMTVNGHRIPAETIVVANIYSIHQNPKFWSQPDVFDPNRFLDSKGLFLVQKPSAFMPFSVGNRQCVGQRLALLDLFLILVRFLQLTDGKMFVISDNSTKCHFAEEIDPKSFFVNKPKPFKVLLQDNKQ